MPEVTDPPLVLIDTNQWRSSLLLRNPLGASLLHALHTSGARILLPQVVEMEIQKSLRKAGKSARTSIAEGLKTLQRLKGTAPIIPLPSDKELDADIEKRIEELEPYIERVPLDNDVALRALERVNDELPPSQHKQQFKDAVIWEVALCAARSREVHLVTEDAAFYESKKPGAGLEQRLSAECSEAGLSITPHRSMGDVVKELVRVAQFDATAAAEAVAKALEEELQEKVRRRDLTLGTRTQDSITAYVTEQPERLALEFALTYEASSSASSTTEGHPTVTAEGECIYIPEGRSAMDVALGTITYRDIPFAGASIRDVSIRAATAWGGLQYEPFTIRTKLPGPEKRLLVTITEDARPKDQLDQ